MSNFAFEKTFVTAQSLTTLTCIIRIALELLPSDFAPKRVRIEYKVAARQGELLTPLLYTDEGHYYIELKCERGTCSIMAFE